MITINHLDEIFSFTLLIFVYLFSITLSGFVKAATAKGLGDDTPELMGFLSLNPMAHFDPIGFLILFYNRSFGWGKEVPLTFYNFSSRYRLAKLFVTYASEILTNLAIALIATLIFIGTFMTESVCNQSFGPRMISYYLVPLKQFTSLFPERSSLALVAGVFLGKLILFNIVLGAIHFLMRIVRISLIAFSNTTESEPRSLITEVIVLCFALFFLGEALIGSIFTLILKTAQFLLISFRLC